MIKPLIDYSLNLKLVMIRIVNSYDKYILKIIKFMANIYKCRKNCKFRIMKKLFRKCSEMLHKKIK